MFVRRVKRIAAVAALLLLMGVEPATDSPAQQIFNGRQRPFVIGLIPVVGRNGRVGGVHVDAAGVLSRAEPDATGRLRDARRKAMNEIPGPMSRFSRMRKVSLRRLEAAMVERANSKRPLGDDITYLAGLQRVEYVFVYPDQHDIVLAGPAEGWNVGPDGELVGLTTGRPVLELADLVVALRTSDDVAKTGISCSIDPDEERLRRLSRSIQGAGARIGSTSAARMANIGPQNITVDGVPTNCHLARVLVAADLMMKRLAMRMERSPVNGLPSYMELIQGSSGRLPKFLMPRWWLAANYERLLSDDDGLAWQLRGPGVKAMTETEQLDASGAAVRAAKPDRYAEAWAKSFSEKYEALSVKIPAFAQLRNCMDLAVVAAVIFRNDLTGQAGFEMPVLLHPKALQPAEYHAPQTVDSRAVVAKRRREWVISVSGGVQFDPWAIAEEFDSSKDLSGVRNKAAAPAAVKSWWWD